MALATLIMSLAQSITVNVGISIWAYPIGCVLYLVPTHVGMCCSASNYGSQIIPIIYHTLWGTCTSFVAKLLVLPNNPFFYPDDVQLDCPSDTHWDVARMSSWLSSILNPRPVLDSAAQTTRSMLLDIFVKHQKWARLASFCVFCFLLAFFI